MLNVSAMALAATATAAALDDHAPRTAFRT
jgi:hypothetical protein